MHAPNVLNIIFAFFIFSTLFFLYIIGSPDFMPREPIMLCIITFIQSDAVYLAKNSSICLCASSMTLSRPAAFSSSMQAGTAVSGSDAPVSISFLYLSHTILQFATSFWISVISSANPRQVEETAVSFCFLTYSQASGSPSVCVDRMKNVPCV